MESTMILLQYRQRSWYARRRAVSGFQRAFYKVSSLFLKSNICIDLDDEAVLSGTIDRKMIPVLPGMIQSYDEEKEYNSRIMEGNPLDCFA